MSIFTGINLSKKIFFWIKIIMIREQFLIMTFLDNFDFWNIFIPKNFIVSVEIFSERHKIHI